MMKKSLLMIGLSLAVLCSCSKSEELNPVNTPLDAAPDTEIETKAEQITLTVHLFLGTETMFYTVDKDLTKYGIDWMDLAFVNTYISYNGGSNYEYETSPVNVRHDNYSYSEIIFLRFTPQTYFAKNLTKFSFSRYSQYTADQFKVVVQGVPNIDDPRW